MMTIRKQNIRGLTAACIACCASLTAVAGPQPPTDPALQQLQQAETATRQAKVEGDKKPPREVRKADHDAKKNSKKDAKKGP